MTRSEPRPPAGEETGQSFSQRFASARAKAGDLAATRAAMFREELSDKGGFAARALAGFAIAIFFCGMALLLLTALVAALLAKLFGSVILGIAATLALALAVAAGGAVLGRRALEKVRPFDFPATGAELLRDLEVLSAAAAPPPEPEEADDGEDLEARFRAGSE